MKTALTIFILILLVVGVIFFVSQGGAQTGGPSIGIIPEVSLQDEQGNLATVHDYLEEGKILVINSWATWCPFCVNELPDFVALQEEFPENVVVIAVNRKESISAANNFLRGLGIENELVYLYDSSDSWYKTLGGFTMPETTFVNSRGELVVHKRGFMALPEMIEHVETTLATN